MSVERSCSALFRAVLAAETAGGELHACTALIALITFRRDCALRSSNWSMDLAWSAATGRLGEGLADVVGCLDCEVLGLVIGGEVEGLPPPLEVSAQTKPPIRTVTSTAASTISSRVRRPVLVPGVSVGYESLTVGVVSAGGAADALCWISKALASDAGSGVEGVDRVSWPGGASPADSASGGGTVWVAG